MDTRETLSKASKPAPSNLPEAQIADLAEKVSKTIRFEPQGEIEDAVERMGGSVGLTDFWAIDNGLAGSLFVKDVGQFEIRVPTHTSRTRDRFTIAHELGHYVLHYLVPLATKGRAPGFMWANRYGTGRIETEANWFAAAFLMPEKRFGEAYRAAQGNLRHLSEEFQVSQAAALIRAQALGLTNSNGGKRKAQGSA